MELQYKITPLQERLSIEIEPEQTIAQIFEQAIPRPYWDMLKPQFHTHKDLPDYSGKIECYRAIVNGEIIPLEKWEYSVIEIGDEIQILPFSAGWIKGALISAAFTFAGVLIGGGSIGLALALAALTFANVAVLYYLAPRPPKASSESPTYKVEGIGNRPRPWQAVPQVFGQVRFFPPQAARTYLETSGKNQYLRFLLDFGIGPVATEDYRIGSIPMDRYKGIDYDTHFNPTALNWYTGIHREEDFEITLGTGWTSIETSDNATEAITQIKFPFGLGRIEGTSVRSKSVRLSYRYRPVGGEWSAVQNTATSDDIVFLAEGEASLYDLPDAYVPATDTRFDFFRNVIPNLNAGQRAILVGPEEDEWMGRTLLSIDPVLIYFPDSTATNNAELRAADGSSFSLAGYGIGIRINGGTQFRAGGVSSAFTTLLNKINLSIPDGINDGDKVEIAIAETIPFSTPRRTSSTAGQITQANFTIKAKTRSPYYHGHRIVFPTSGRYEIAFKRNSTESTNLLDLERVVIDSLQTIKPEFPIKVPNHSFIEGRIKATDQLSGRIDNLTCLAFSQVEVHNGTGAWTDDSSWVPTATRNPAWHCVAVLRDGGARAVSRLSISESWRDFAAHCDTRGYQFNGVLDSIQTKRDAIAQILELTHAQISVSNGQYGVVWNDATAPITQIFSPRNSGSMSRSVNYLDKLHGIRVSYQDPARDWTIQEVIAYAQGYSESNADLFESREVIGITSREQAVRYGRFILAEREHRPVIYNWTAAWDALVCTRGDRVALQSYSIGVRAASGRLKIVENLQDFICFVLDVPYSDIVDVFSLYTARISTRDGVLNIPRIYYDISLGPNFNLEGFCINPSISPEGFSALRSAIDSGQVQEGDHCIIGEQGQDSIDVRIQEIRYTAEGTASLIGTDWNVSTIHTAEDTGTIPDYDPSIPDILPLQGTTAPEPPVIEEVRADIQGVPGDGNYNAGILIKFLARAVSETPNLKLHIVIQSRQGGDTRSEVFPASIISHRFDNCQIGASYRVLAWYENEEGVRSASATRSVLVYGLSDTVHLPTSFSANAIAGIGTRIFSWTYPLGTSVKSIKLAYASGSNQTSGFTHLATIDAGAGTFESIRPVGTGNFTIQYISIDAGGVRESDAGYYNANFAVDTQNPDIVAERGPGVFTVQVLGFKGWDNTSDGVNANAVANMATPGDNLIGDVVTIVESNPASGVNPVVESRVWNIGSGGVADWNMISNWIDGHLVVGGSVNSVFDITAGRNIQSSNYIPNTRGFIFRSDGTAELDGLSIRGTLSAAVIDDVIKSGFAWTGTEDFDFVRQVPSFINQPGYGYRRLIIKFDDTENWTSFGIYSIAGSVRRFNYFRRVHINTGNFQSDSYNPYFFSAGSTIDDNERIRISNRSDVPSNELWLEIAHFAFISESYATRVYYQVLGFRDN